ncbi:hypothetical protein PUN28_010646 [Cardiocondyla obscurior]|uniref:Uncharacterized protein n=1 Tax=Cardiocondyla obscurior TaxID=286306 RepID=A0AAW2FJH2_9HYME
MQILFTLGCPPPFVSLYRSSRSLFLPLTLAIHVKPLTRPSLALSLSLFLSLSFSFSLLFLSLVTSHGKRSDARRTCAPPPLVPRTHPHTLHPRPPFRFHTLPRNPIVPLFMPISSFSFAYNIRDGIDFTDNLISQNHYIYCTAHGSFASLESNRRAICHARHS